MAFLGMSPGEAISLGALPTCDVGSVLEPPLGRASDTYLFFFEHLILARNLRSADRCWLRIGQGTRIPAFLAGSGQDF